MLVNEDNENNESITISEIKSDTKQFVNINNNDIKKIIDIAKQKYKA
jgi:hypothetical protein